MCMSLFPSVTYPATLDNVCLFILYRNKVILNKEKRCYTMFHYTSRGTFWIFFFRLHTVFIMTWRLCLQHDIGALKHHKSQILTTLLDVFGQRKYVQYTDIFTSVGASPAYPSIWQISCQSRGTLCSHVTWKLSYFTNPDLLINRYRMHFLYK